MCVGGGNSGAAAQADEDRRRLEREAAERDRNIRRGEKRIDKAFAGYDDDFFSGFQDTVLDYYQPQLDQQLGDAEEATLANLVERGMLESTAGARAFGDLREADARARGDIADRAVTESKSLRSNIENERGDLLALNDASADPSRVGAAVDGATRSIAVPQTFQPLDDVFAPALRNLALFQTASNNRAPANTVATPTTPSTSRLKTGSGRVVSEG